MQISCQQTYSVPLNFRVHIFRLSKKDQVSLLCVSYNAKLQVMHLYSSVTFHYISKARQFYASLLSHADRRSRAMGVCLCLAPSKLQKTTIIVQMSSNTHQNACFPVVFFWSIENFDPIMMVFCNLLPGTPYAHVRQGLCLLSERQPSISKNVP